MRFRFARIILILATALTSRADRPHNIFDDDWTPPKAARTPPPDPTIKPPSPTPNKTTPTPAIPKEITVTPPIAPEVKPARLAIPTPAAQAPVRKVLKEVFAHQIADRSVAARHKLTAALLAQAEKSDGIPVDQFVLLAAAIDSSIESASLPLAITAADKLSTTFDIDALSLKADAALRIAPQANLAEQGASNVTAAIELADALASANDYPAALKIVTAFEHTTALITPALRAQLQRQQRDFSAARAAGDQYVHDLTTLAANPNDPAANQSVGRYLCFFKNDWESGLPLLAKSADPVMKSLAMAELSKPALPEAIADLADKWWETATAQSNSAAKLALTAHAGELYAGIKGRLTGLRGAQIQQRLEEAEKTAARLPSGALDILKLVGKDARFSADHWTATSTSVKNNKHGSHLRLPYSPPEEYDLHVTFERLDAHDTISILCPLPHGQVIWCAGGWGDVVFGFTIFKDGGWRTLSKRELPTDTIKTGVSYDCVIRVRKNKVTATLDGKLLNEFITDGTGCQIDNGKINGQPVLGFNANPRVEFSQVILTEITGEGHIVTDPN